MASLTSDVWILKVAIARPLHVLFTYRIPENLKRSIDQIETGTVLQIPFGKTTIYGFAAQKPELISNEEFKKLEKDFKIREINNIIYEIQIAKDVVELSKWVSEYYHIPLGEIFQSVVPIKTLLKPISDRSKNKSNIKSLSSVYESIDQIQLNSEQIAAVEVIDQAIQDVRFKPILLEGVTGSGKTEVYSAAAKRVLNAGKSVLFLVPEISLTPQTQARIEGRLQTYTAVWHSAISDGERRRTYQGCVDGSVKVLIGARSAVFSPLQNLGLIIVDEEHDPSYKQEERIRYHGRDVAIMRAKKVGIPIILGSATPSFESLENVKNHRYQHIQLHHRAQNSVLPIVEITDLTEAHCVPNIQIPLAETTLTHLKETLKKGEQALVFLNRRGWASFLLCSACGHVPTCSACSISMTYHKGIKKLKCHLCGHHEKPPEICEKCDGYDWIPIGTGTESAESELESLLPNVKIGRLDRDQITSHSRLEKLLDEFRKGDIQVLVGTQMLVKGHDFPNVTLVVILLADSLFKWPDFRAAERAYQVLSQVSGRAGRGQKPGKVIIQTFNPDHAVLKTLTNEIKIDDFRGSEQEVRKLLHYPPFGRMIRIRVSHIDKNLSLENIKLISTSLSDPEVEILGPNEAIIERINGEYRWDLVLRSTALQPLHRLTQQAILIAQNNDFQISIDVDPVSMS